jgi:hypothetical protein
MPPERRAWEPDPLFSGQGRRACESSLATNCTKAKGPISVIREIRGCERVVTAGGDGWARIWNPRTGD